MSFKALNMQASMHRCPPVSWEHGHVRDLFDFTDKNKALRGGKETWWKEVWSLNILIKLDHSPSESCTKENSILCSLSHYNIESLCFSSFAFPRNKFTKLKTTI